MFIVFVYPPCPVMMRALIPLLLFVSLKSAKYLVVETESDEEVNYRSWSLMLKCFNYPTLNEFDLVAKGIYPI